MSISRHGKSGCTHSCSKACCSNSTVKMLLPTLLRAPSKCRSAAHEHVHNSNATGITNFCISKPQLPSSQGQLCRGRAAIPLTCSAAAAAAAAAADVADTVSLDSWLASQIITGGSIDLDDDYSSSSSSGIGHRRRRRRLTASNSSSRVYNTPKLSVQATADTVQTAAGSVEQQQQQQRTYPYVNPESGQQYVDPRSIPPRPWAAGIRAAPPAAAAAAAAGVTADQPIANLIYKIADWNSSSSSGSSTTASADKGPMTATSTTGVQQWDDSFVQAVLSAVAAAADAARQRGRVQQQRARYRGSRSSSSSSSSSNVAGALQPDRMEQQQQQQQQGDAGAVIQQQQHMLQELISTQQQQQQQQQQQSVGGAADPQVATLLSYVKSDQPPKPWAWQTIGYESSSSSSSSRSSSHAADQIISSSSLQGWGYSSISSAISQPRLQRAQWVVEELNRVQYAAAAAGSSGARTAAYARDLQIQLRRLLLSHLKREVTHWRQVATACDMFIDHLTPQIVCGALTTLQHLVQQQQQQQQIRSRSEKQRVLGVMQRLLGLIWRWRDQLGLRECIAVAWVLVKVKTIKPEVKSPLRDALAQRYAAHVAAAAARQQQQQHITVHQHATMLLALAQLSLPTNALGKGTVSALCRAAVRQIRDHHHHHHHQQQQQQQQQQLEIPGSSSSRDPCLPSSLSLLLYAMSELKVTPCSNLLKTCGWYTASLLPHMAAADVSLLAIAFGRFGYVPTRFWAGKFLAATAAAATRTSSEISSSSGSEVQRMPSAAAAAAAANHPTTTTTSSSSSSSSSSKLNATDVTSLIVAVHSMNVKASKQWLDSMLAAAAALLPTFDLQQCIVLLLGIHRLEVQPTEHALLSVAEHVTGLISSSSNTVNSSSSNDLSSNNHTDTSSSVEMMPRLQQQQQQQQAEEEQQRQAEEQQQQQQSQTHIRLHRPPVDWLQQQQQNQAAAAAASQAADRWQYAQSRRLCLYIKALAKAASLLPPDAAATTRQQLLPHVAAAARHLAPHMRHLKPLDLLQLVSGLSDLKCRPGPGFMSAHVSQCEVLQRRFNKSMLRQLQQAYQGLGYQPGRVLWALMLAAEDHASLAMVT